MEVKDNGGVGKEYRELPTNLFFYCSKRVDWKTTRRLHCWSWPTKGRSRNLVRLID